jgi:hypothetical protein
VDVDGAGRARSWTALRVRPRCGPGLAMRLPGRDIAVRGDQHQPVVEVMQMRREPTDSARLGPLERQAALARMAEGVFDVVIVGGG